MAAVEKEGEKSCSGTHLYSILRKICFQRQHFACVDVWVVCLLERFLQLVKLVARENRSAAKSFQINFNFN